MRDGYRSRILILQNETFTCFCLPNTKQYIYFLYKKKTLLKKVWKTHGLGHETRINC